MGVQLKKGPCSTSFLWMMMFGALSLLVAKEPLFILDSASRLGVPSNDFSSRHLRIIYNSYGQPGSLASSSGLDTFHCGTKKKAIVSLSSSFLLQCLPFHLY